MNRTKEAERLLRCLGAQGTGYGLRQMACAVEAAMEDMSRLNHITKGLYQDVASEFNTDWKNIEKNIRSIRDTIWAEGERGLLEELCGHRLERKPTNTQLLKILAEYLQSLEQSENIKKVITVSPTADTEVISPLVKRIVTPHKENNDRETIAALTKRIAALEEERAALKDTISWMHDLIWDLLRIIK